ncbi:copper amine oxidase N-terminal domain-containing protein [Rubeoparvulum massiliense]|uniref:copper amine oxidase N-terminal domain-containing protein n=1 Tax=Rubeoparvulum massiliense TaxID=1631346 RepID=UPI00065E6ED1|nr:copper amine oxidase N-terminal domain-containing protein [Rubeoparvulum massiliense]
MKKFLSTVIIGTLLTTSLPVLAESPEPVLYNGSNHSELIAQNPQSNEHSTNAIRINQGLLDTSLTWYTTEHGDVLIPLRVIAEALGYEVIWHGENQSIELVRLPHWVTLSIGEDQYGFGKMAPQPLGVAPVLRENHTYVPLSLFTQLIPGYEGKVEGNILSITAEENNQEAEASQLGEIYGTINKLTSTNHGISLEVVQDGKEAMPENTIILHVSDETVILNPITGESLSSSKLQEGDLIRASYGPAVALSMPPQSAAVRIEVLQEVGFTTGTIGEIHETDGITSILVGDLTKGIQFTIGKETIIVDQDDKVLPISSLSKDMKVDVYHSLAMTKSLPPIANAYKVVVK